MNKIVNLIIKSNFQLFNEYKKISKINVGFTNTLYDVDNKYIIKICTDINNELKFKKEILFYENNKNNRLIPKLYYADTSKKEVPYMYEILEKIEGVSLYDIWHTFDDKAKEEVIKQLCEAMKKFHTNKGKDYDWLQKTSELFLNLYNQAKSLNLFKKDELGLFDKAYLKFPQILYPTELVLVHNDLHFDNILYKNGQIKLIDFERSIYAPRDFELDIIYRMVRKPWKFASEENEKYTKVDDYKNVMSYIEKYYPELIHIKYLYERLAIYDVIYYLKQYINNPTLKDLKKEIIKALNIINIVL